jgi:Fe-Mn family superoxide dismutase
MVHKLPELPYSLGALAPRLSAETLEYHWGKHHRAYVDNLNKLVAGTPHAEQPLEDIVRKSSGAVFNNAAQHFNHSLYWSSLSPQGGGEPRGPLAEAIRRRYESYAAFRTAFTQKATALFGSGWCWLVLKSDHTLDIEPTHDAGCPLLEGGTPLLACDVWEHAYYIDYRNARAKYVEAFWELVNWRFAEQAFETLSAERSAVSAAAGRQRV